MNSGLCICSKKVSQDEVDIIKCEKCALTMHHKCYTGNSNDKLEPNDSLCITCTVNKINPFESVDAPYLNPVILPRKPSLKTGNISGNFVLSEEIIKKVKKDGNYKVFLYCVLHDSTFQSEKGYIWPENFEISFNTHKMKQNNNEPLELTLYVKSSSNNILFSYKQLNKDYILFVLGTKQVSPKQLHDSLEQCRQYSIEECKVLICNILKKSEIEKENLSLKCVYSLAIMDIPVRGNRCMHIGCFDLLNYLTCCKKTKIWKCPICKKITYYKDLIIDNYIKSIITEYKKLNNDTNLIFIDCEGNWKIEKYEYKYSHDKNEYFGEKAQNFVEQQNYSPKRTQKEVLMDLDNDDVSENEKENEQLRILKKSYADLLSQNIDNYDKIIEKLKSKSLLKDLSIPCLITFLNDFNLKPNKTAKIFPSFTQEMSSVMYFRKCEGLYQKFINFNKITSLWSTNYLNLVNLTIEISKQKAADDTYTIDHYLSLELLISSAFNIYQQNNKSNLLEYLIGKLLGLYSKTCNFNEIQTSHVIDQITILFPSFYLPKHDFATDRDQKDYFEKMVMFFQGFISDFSPSVVGKIFKKLFIPIKTPITKLSDVEICYLKLIEDLFFNSLFQKLEYSTYHRGLFISEFDSYGYFRDFLRTIDKLYKYGYEYDNYNDILEINNNGNISSLFKLRNDEFGISKDNGNLCKLLNR